MKAYHSNPQLKSEILATLAAHRAADELFFSAFKAGVLTVDFDRGLIFGSRWGRNRHRGTKNPNGYVVFSLHFNGQRQQIKAHRAIWLAKHGKIQEDMMIDHINRCKDDNRLVNLRLVTPSGNAANRRAYSGSANPSAKLNENSVANIRKIRLGGESYAEIARRFDVSKSLVAQIIRGEVWK